MASDVKDVLAEATEPARNLSQPTPLAYLRALFELLKKNGATYHKDGVLEIHLTNHELAKKKPDTLDRDIDLGPV